MCLLFVKFPDNKCDYAVLIFRNIHHVEILAEKLSDLFHLDSRYHLTNGDTCLADFCFLPKHIGEPGVCGLYRRAAVLNRHLLLDDKLSYYGSNINFMPTVRNPLIAALHIIHRGRQLGTILHDQEFFHFSRRIAIRLCAGKNGFGICQNSGYF